MTRPGSDADRRRMHGALRPLDDRARTRLDLGLLGLILVVLLVPALLWLVAEQLATASPPAGDRQHAETAAEVTP